MIGGLAAPQPYPDYEPVEPGTLLLLGDLHEERGANQALHSYRTFFDLDYLDVDQILQAGDVCEDGTAAQDANAKPKLQATRAPLLHILGNHDYENLGAGRSGADAIASLAINALRWTFDAGTHVVLGVSPVEWGFTNGHHSAQIDLDESVQWIADQAEAEAAGAGRDVWVLAHAPLQIGWGGAVQWQAQPAAAIAAMLDAHPNITIWLSGHTHTPPTFAAGVEIYDLGTRPIIDMNVGAIAYQNPGDDLADRVQSLAANHVPGGARFRIRDHEYRQWCQWPEREYVRELTVP